MHSLYSSIAALPLFVIGAWAKANLQPLPGDLTTPVQQRIAVDGPNSEY